MSNADGMCRPLGYQFFLFVGDDFAGTLSPAPMDSRTDGGLSDLQLARRGERHRDVLALHRGGCAVLPVGASRPSSMRSSNATAVPCLVRAVGADHPARASRRARSAAADLEPEASAPVRRSTPGNTDTSSYNLTFDAVRDPKKKWIFRTDGLYLAQRGERRGHRRDKSTFNVREERSLGDRLFAYADVRYLRDRFKDIDYLVTPMVGIGWKAILPEPVSSELRRRRRRRVREEPRLREHLERVPSASASRWSGRSRTRPR